MRGFYLELNGAFLGLTNGPPETFDADGHALGGDLGLRLGYRILDCLGIDLGAQLMTASASGTARFSFGAPFAPPPYQGPVESIENSSYTLQAVRIGANLLVLAPGRSSLRFVGSIGGGLALERLLWHLSTSPSDVSYVWGDPSIPAIPGGAEFLPANTDGRAGYGELNLGIELELGHALFGLALRGIVQTSGCLEGLRVLVGRYPGASGRPWSYDPYGGSALFFIGPAVHVGYGFW